MPKLFSLAVSLVLLQACAASGIDGVKSQHSRHETFRVEENYQSVFRRISRRVPECFSNPMAIAAQSNLYHDIEAGELTVGNSLGTFLVVEVKGLGPNAAKVDVYTGVSTWDKYVERVKGWIDGTYSGC
jgi:hypothetical protein